MNRKIICTNDDGISLEFGSTYAPFLLQDCEGIYEVQNDVITQSNTMIDGATYYGSHTQLRNIVLTLADRGEHADNRNILYRLFKAKGKGTFTYIENDVNRAIDYYVESIQFSSVNEVRIATVSLICPQPYFSDLTDIVVTMNGWQPLWEFVHEFKSEEFGKRVQEQLKTIDNTSSGDVGITIEITAEYELTNPSIMHVEKDQIVKVGTSAKPFKMQRGDKLIITTETNNKNVKLVRDGVTTIINEYLDEDSIFFTLSQGYNSLRYDADTGNGYMQVSVSFRYKYLGV